MWRTLWSEKRAVLHGGGRNHRFGLADGVRSLRGYPAWGDIWRTRSMTRARRVEVESTSVPQAELSTAGVIIAVRTASAELGAFREVSQSMCRN